MLFFLKKAILARTELAYGTDAVPTGAAHAMLVRNLSITPLEAELAAREVVLPTFGNLGAVPGAAHVKCEFEVEVAGSGEAGVAPPWGSLVRACAFSETATPGVDVLYRPVSTAFEAVSIYYHLDGVRHRIIGSRGTVSLEFSYDAIPVLKFSFTGIYQAPGDAPLPLLTLGAWQRPLPMNRVNTPSFSLHGFAAVLANLSIEVGNVVSFKSYVQSIEEVRIADRKWSGSATVEATLLATKDWFATARDATTGTMNLVHGVTPGNRIQIESPAVQIGNPGYEDVDGVAMLKLPLIFQTSGAGDNELTIRVS